VLSLSTFAKSNKSIKTLKGDNDCVMSVSYSPDGKYLASGSCDGTIKIWDVNTGNCLKTFSGHNDVSYSPDGKYLASGSRDGTIELWDVSKFCKYYETSKVFMNIFPLILIIILIYTIFYLILKGKPQKIKLIINGYLDSFETIDYKKYGRLMTPYKYWDSSIDYLVIDGEVFYKSDNYIFNWKPEIYLKIQQGNIPEGFDIFIKPTFNSTKEYSNDAIMTLKTDKNRKIKFIVCLRQNDINVKINEPILISFKINAFIRETKFLFFNANINETIEYKFHIGGDLGDTWVAFDPGTTGSCVAIGNQPENITICKDSYYQKIIDSKLNFFINEDYISNNGEIPEYLYEYGTKANTKFGSNGVVSFQSIKKLLGYKDKKEISFKNNKLYLSGKELSSLLVKGLYNETINFIKRLNNNEFLNSSNFNLQRAVVTIPTNFKSSGGQVPIEYFLTDIAVLEVPEISEIVPLELGESDEVNNLDEVILIGYPHGDYSITEGNINSKEFQGYDLFKLDAASNPGNSGGPCILKSDNTVIGILVGGSGPLYQGENVALKINVVKKILDEQHITYN